MNAKLCTFRCPSRFSRLLLAGFALTFAAPQMSHSQSQFAYDATSRIVYPYPVSYQRPYPVRQVSVQPVQGASQVVYYRGIDGRVYGTVVRTEISPPAMKPQQLQSNWPHYQAPSLPQGAYQPGLSTRRIVIEDVESQPSRHQELAPPQPPTNYASNSSGNMDTSARSQAEITLRRFEELQGVVQDNPAPEVTKQLPPPKAY